MTTYTFRLGPNEPVRFTILAPSAGHAYTAANNYFGHIPGFYAWYGDGPDFVATYGVWD